MFALCFSWRRLVSDLDLSTEISLKHHAWASSRNTQFQVSISRLRKVGLATRKHLSLGSFTTPTTDKRVPDQNHHVRCRYDFVPIASQILVKLLISDFFVLCTLLSMVYLSSRFDADELYASQLTESDCPRYPSFGLIPVASSCKCFVYQYHYLFLERLPYLFTLAP